jgi:ADP-L-glycero-D-manno-heptose 6-epimerase
VRILVTGGAGFVVALDDFSSATWTNLIDFQGDVVTCDVSDDVSVLQRLDACDVIFHEGSITDTTVMDQRKMMHNNVEGFRNLLDQAIRWGSRVVWASSAATYGRGPSPNKESQAPAPLNVYGYSKLAMEHLAAQYAPRLKHPIVALRYFNVYGPGEQHKGKFASMIHQLAKQMRAGHRPRIFKMGEQKRDFVYIDDLIAANLAAMKANQSGVFNVGSGAAASFNDVVEQLNRVLKTDLQPDYIDNPYDFFQTHTEADLTQSRAVLGYSPQYDLRKGVDAYFASGTLGM